MKLFSWLRQRITGKPQKRRSPVCPPAPRFRPLLEELEERCLPSFSSPITSAVSQPVAQAIADLNNDGKPDLVVSTTITGISVMLGKGSGRFGTATYYNNGAGGYSTALAVDDVNGDKIPDIIMGNEPADLALPTISVMLGKGNGTFSA
jgi:hypothetical protein